MVGEYAFRDGGIYPPWMYDPHNFYCNVKNYVDKCKGSISCSLHYALYVRRSYIKWAEDQMHALLLMVKCPGIRLYGSMLFPFLCATARVLDCIVLLT